jgi:hypothetical protein
MNGSRTTFSYARRRSPSSGSFAIRKGASGLVCVPAVLHTWTRDLSYRPHIHAIATGCAL